MERIVLIIPMAETGRTLGFFPAMIRAKPTPHHRPLPGPHPSLRVPCAVAWADVLAGA
jgi:hypothetical protein